MSRATSWFAALQRALPQHGLSRGIGHLARSEVPWIKGPFIRSFARAYAVNMSEAAEPSLDAYASFNAFFTRALREGARPIAADEDVLVCPADGCISQLGAIEGDTLLQAKGHGYTLASLAGELGAGFHDGSFCTIYLAPSDYHRVHAPFGGTLTDTLAVPGALYSVNGTTEQAIEGLFVRNERLVCRFETTFGPMLVVLVGAMIVASIETVWAGPVSPYAVETREQHGDDNLHFEKGAELGRFLLGSTVICCFPAGAVHLGDTLRTGSTVRMGSPMARLRG